MDPIQAANILLGIWEVLQGSSDSEVHSPDVDVARASAEISAREAADRRYAGVDERLARLVLVVRAMWTLLAEKSGLTDADLLKRMKELDAADGGGDGGAAKAPFRCSCGAMVSRRLNRCLFCGKVYGDADVLNAL